MKQPDIIFIVLDTQRADRLGCYGHNREITPNIDRFASQAILFEQAIAPAQWTIPSHASMFTGLYPTAHQVTQSNQRLGRDMPHLVELLTDKAYETIGFCNNPLVGVLDNGFTRGFKAFYNYGGAFPTRPPSPNKLPWPLRQLSEAASKLLHRIAYPIQNFFGQSEFAFSLSLYAWLTPLWSKWANFKGQNERSVKDVCQFLEARERLEADRPLFLFLNLMETHLPFFPPQKFIDQVAPYLSQEKEARAYLHQWNREAYRWAAPLPDGLNELERRVLTDMYDAEVAYQDEYLQQLFEVLEARQNRDNTLTIIVGDHGDSLGEHDYFGHAFVAYQELVHVPMILHWPTRLSASQRVAQPVSTRRVFHTLVAAAFAGSDEEALLQEAGLNLAEMRGLSLAEVANGRDAEDGTAFAEIYPPLNFVRAIERRQPELIEQFRCLDLRRAIVSNDLKLIQIDDEPDELFNLVQDRLELDNILDTDLSAKSKLNQRLNRIINTVESQRDTLLAGAPLDLENDEQLLQRLRGLGYID